MIRLFALLVCLVGMSASSAVSAQDNSPWRVSLVTIGPGEIYWTRFGHNAIMVERSHGGRALLYNFGIFDFEQENFLLNFLRGRMIYRLDAFYTEPNFREYLETGRWLQVQRLNLSPAQTRTLVEHLEWHRRPENAEYLYDYFLNNCSTKVRDALDLALGGQLEAAFGDRPSLQGNFRDHTNRLTAPQWWLYLGTQLGLGRPVDRSISRWDEFFIPMTMMRAVRDLEIRWEDGSRHPLVAEDISVDIPNAAEAPSRQPGWWPWFLVGGLVLTGLILVGDRNRSRPGISIAWWTLTGLIGLALLGLWTLTDHQAAYRNENLLLFSPLGILLAGAALFRSPRLLRISAILLIASLAAALLLKFVLDPVQDNWEWLAFCVPVQLTASLFALRGMKQER